MAISVLVFGVCCCSLAQSHVLRDVELSNAITDMASLETKKYMDDVYVQFSQLPNNVEALIGQSVVLECGVNGVPQPRAYFLKNGRKIHHAEVQHFPDKAFDDALNQGKLTVQNGITIAKLQIDCVTPDVAGQYECVADNGYKKIISKQFSVDVLPSQVGLLRCLNEQGGQSGRPPYIYMRTESRLEVSGAAVQLLCRATGFPESVVQWKDNEDNIILNDDERYQLLNNGDLLIKEVDWSMMGLFSCTASNGLGQDVAKAFLYPTAKEPTGKQSLEDVSPELTFSKR